VSSYDTWFVRGGDNTNGLNTGVFAFTNDFGRLAGWISFRVVIKYYF